MGVGLFWVRSSLWAASCAPRRVHVALIEQGRDPCVGCCAACERLDPCLCGVRRGVAAAGRFTDGLFGYAPLAVASEYRVAMNRPPARAAATRGGCFFATLAAAAAGKSTWQSRRSRKAESFSSDALFVSFIVSNNRSIISDHCAPDTTGCIELAQKHR